MDPTQTGATSSNASSNASSNTSGSNGGGAASNNGGTQAAGSYTGTSGTTGNSGTSGTSGTTGAHDAREKLMGDMKTVINDAETWLKSSAHQTGEEVRAARTKFETTLQTAKSDLMKLEERMLARTKDAARMADEYVTDNPWKAVGLGAAVGVICGMLISHK